METEREGKRGRAASAASRVLRKLPGVLRLAAVRPNSEMTIFRTDRLFAEAAQSPKHCDRLLQRLKRSRVTILILLLVIAALAGAGLWYEASRFTRCVDTIANSSLGDKTPDVPGLSLIGYLSLTLTFTVFLELIFFNHTDTCVKMLIILQQQQSVARAKDAPDPN